MEAGCIMKEVMSYKPRSDMPPDGFTLPARYYTDPEYFKEEFERFFFHLWIHAGRADQIREPGEYFVRNVGGESVVVTRSASGGLTAFYNVCRHRGTRLCQGEEGRFQGSIQCPYHAWTYDLDGRLIGAPHMEEVPHFRREDYPLNRVHVDTWDGHIFLNFSKDPQPLRAQLASLPDKFRPWHMEELRLGGRLHYHIKANWKLILQNYSECLHCPLIHPVLNKLSHYLSGENEPLHPSYMGGVMDLSDGVKTMTLDGQCSREFLPGISPEDSRRVYYYAIFPNMLLTLHPDYMMTHTLWPRACDLTENVCEFYFHPVEMAKPGFSAQDALEFWDLTNKQDWLVSELSQQGISSRAYRPGPYSNREDLLYAFDRMIVAADDEKLEHKR
jgi:glycine betaine catabolism A